MDHKIKIAYGKYIGEFEAKVYKKRQIWGKVYWSQIKIFRGSEEQIQAFTISFQSLHTSLVVDSIGILNTVKIGREDFETNHSLS